MPLMLEEITSHFLPVHIYFVRQCCKWSFVFVGFPLELVGLTEFEFELLYLFLLHFVPTISCKNPSKDFINSLVVRV